MRFSPIKLRACQPSGCHDLKEKKIEMWIRIEDPSISLLAVPGYSRIFSRDSRTEYLNPVEAVKKEQGLLKELKEKSLTLTADGSMI